MKKAIALLLFFVLFATCLAGCSHDTPSVDDGENSNSAHGSSADSQNEESQIESTEGSASPEPRFTEDFQYEISKSGTGIWLNQYIGLSEHVEIPSTIDNLPVISLITLPTSHV